MIAAAALCASTAAAPSSYGSRAHASGVRDIPRRASPMFPGHPPPVRNTLPPSVCTSPPCALNTATGGCSKRVGSAERNTAVCS